MIPFNTSALATCALIALGVAAPAYAESAGAQRGAPANRAAAPVAPGASVEAVIIDPRPEDPTVNLPSDTGSQTELPTGAVTGAGHAHGTIPMPDTGEPGGLEERARLRERQANPGIVGAEGVVIETTPATPAARSGSPRGPAGAITN